MTTAPIETLVGQRPAVRKLRNIPEGNVQCITPSCRQIIPQEQARNYGAGYVCPPCYDRWFRSED